LLGPPYIDGRRAKAAEKAPRKKGVEEMMERLEKLGRRLRFRQEEAGEQNKPDKKGLRWYHKAFVVLALALTVFGGSLTSLDQAQASHVYYWGQCSMSYGTTWYATCLNTEDHATGRHYSVGWGYWESSGAFRYMPDNDPCHYWLWIGDRWVGPWTHDFCQW
jgi:hypothetical protein